MKVSYSILHVDKDIDRNPLLLENKSYLNRRATDLKSKAYGIYSMEDFKEYSKEEHALTVDPGNGFRYSEIGCWASHHMAWKTFYESDNDIAIIFEDDIKIVDGFYENLMDNLNNLPEDWNAFFCLVPDACFDLYNSSHYIGQKYVCKAYQGNWLGAYVINKSGAKKLLDSSLGGITRPVDIHIFYSEGLLNGYSVRPNTKCFVRGLDLGTTIHHVERFNDEAL